MGRGKGLRLRSWFSTSRPANIDNNFTEKIEKIKKILGSWSARRLTLVGKIAILKALAVSQIVYVLSSLPTPKGVIKEINALLYYFIRDNKGEKIKRTEMINDYSKGGGLNAGQHQQITATPKFFTRCPGKLHQFSIPDSNADF